jgi:hypothetical protein
MPHSDAENFKLGHYRTQENAAPGSPASWKRRRPAPFTGPALSQAQASPPRLSRLLRQQELRGLRRR